MIDPAPSDTELELTYDSPVLLTERLVLRPPHLDDIDELAEIANNRRIAEMTSRMPFPYGVKDAEAFIDGCRNGRYGSHVYAITLADTGRLIGMCSLENRERTGGFEIGFWLGDPWWGKGYATEAASTLVDQAFRSTAAERIHALCRTVNSASRNVIRKCGFSFVGLDEMETVTAGRVAIERYLLDRSVWLMRKASDGQKGPDLSGD